MESFGYKMLSQDISYSASPCLKGKDENQIAYAHVCRLMNH